ncbi:NAD(P)H-dependent oxidoreductase [Candidatus Bathyarchaeota archaeon]|nr:NAD(P)H-dependent oxidoreductase [Candidatus Bathyarchaeota archaeon]
MSVFIVGIVGSPRKGGLTTKLVTKALEGAKEKGASVKLVYLVDYDLKPWTPEHGSAPEELNELMRRADGYVVGSPVYYLDVNGLTKNFFDAVDLGDSNGKPALGIAVAGGTGKGLVLAVKTIYYYFFCKGLRGLEPIPVSRFNFDEALENARRSGALLAEKASERKPFRSLKERIAYFESLKYMSMTMLDEIMLLASQLFKTSPRRDNLKKARESYAKAAKLIEEGKRLEAIPHAVKAYELLYYR